MPRLNITNAQFSTAKQPIQNRYVKIELLNYQFQTVDLIEGKCTNGSLTIDSNSDIRRTGSITLTVTDSSFEVEPGGRIWLDKYLRVWIGTQGVYDIAWTNCGIFIIDAPKYHYDVANNTLTLSLLDLMAKMTGIRNGYIKGVPVSIKAGEKIREAVIGILELGGFSQYIVETPPEPGTIPVDIDFGQGVTLYEMLKAILDIYPNYEMFFDANGTFVYQKIPTGDGDPILIDDTLWSNIVISEDIDVDFQNVKNSIEVYGRTHNPAYFSTKTTVENNIIKLTIAGVESYQEGLIYGFTLTDNQGYSSPSLQINGLAVYPIKLENGTTDIDILPEKGEVYYCVQYRKGYWNWLGHLQAYGKKEDTNPDSPFYVEGTVGRIRLPLFGGEYENIYSDDLARQRAEYELYLHANMNDTVTLTCVPVYWLDANILVEYTVKRNDKKNKYLIKSINMGLSSNDTMTVSLMKFYPIEERRAQ